LSQCRSRRTRFPGGGGSAGDRHAVVVQKDLLAKTAVQPDEGHGWRGVAASRTVGPGHRQPRGLVVQTFGQLPARQILQGTPACPSTRPSGARIVANGGFSNLGLSADDFYSCGTGSCVTLHSAHTHTGK